MAWHQAWPPGRIQPELWASLSLGTILIFCKAPKQADNDLLEAIMCISDNDRGRGW